MWRRSLVVSVCVANVVAVGRVLSLRHHVRETDLAKVVRAAELSGHRLNLPASGPAAVLILDPSTVDTTAVLDQAAAEDVERILRLIVVTPVSNRAISFGSRWSGLAQELPIPASAGPSVLGLDDAWNRWLLYDRTGARTYQGDFIDGGLKGALASLLRDDPDFRTTVSQELTTLSTTESFKSAIFDGRKALEGQVEAVLFVSRAWTTCPVASSLALMQQSAQRHSAFRMSVVVPATWSRGDIASFRSSFDLQLPIKVADDETTRRWGELAAAYGESAAGAFLAVFRGHHLFSVYADLAPMRQFLVDDGDGKE